MQRFKTRARRGPNHQGSGYWDCSVLFFWQEIWERKRGSVCARKPAVAWVPNQRLPGARGRFVIWYNVSFPLSATVQQGVPNAIVRVSAGGFERGQ